MAALVLLVGCARDNPLYSVSESGTEGSSNSSSATGGISPTSGGSNVSVGASSSTTTVDGTESTSSGSSESAETNATSGESSSSTGIERPGCPYPADDNVVARYRFDDAMEPWTDDEGVHDGSLYSGVPDSVAGPIGCGRALGATPGLAGEVADDPAFDLALGSIDFWVMAPGIEDSVPLLSRDASDADSEHVTFFLSRTENEKGDGNARHLIVRHQSMDTGAAVCSEAPLPVGVWVHVGYNFGPPRMELFIDGVLQESDDVPTVPGGGIPACDGRTNDMAFKSDPPPFVGGIQTDLPWFVAATAQGSDKAVQDPETFMSAGALDEIRISSVRRNFAEL